MAVAVSTGGCVVCWLWTVSLQLFYLGDIFFLKSRWGYSQDVAQDDIYSIYTFVGAFNVSPDSSEDTDRHWK